MKDESPKKLKTPKDQISILNTFVDGQKQNKISRGAGKTKPSINYHPNKSVDYDLKIKKDDKKLLPSKHVKYLVGITIDSHLNWLHQSSTLMVIKYQQRLECYLK